MQNTILQRHIESERYALAQFAVESGLYPYYRVAQSAPDAEMTVEGQRRVNLGSNNYLGLANDPVVVAAAKAATDRYGAGVGGSRLLNGTLDLHLALEDDVRSFYGAEDAVVVTTGYGSNLALLAGLLAPGDLVVVDEESHNSIQSGLKLSGAEVAKFPHNDLEEAERLLRAAPADRGKVIVVDGVYSMSGDIAPLPGLVALRDSVPNTLLIVDEAHGLGVCGPRGLGAIEQFGVVDDVDFITLTFSKSLGSCGGAVVSRHGETMRSLRLAARMNPFVFTASNTPASVGAAQAALRIIRDEPDRVDRLRSNVSLFIDLLAEHGASPSRTGSAIVTVPLAKGDDLSTITVGGALMNSGVFCNIVLYPAVPPDGGIVRFSVMATHTADQLGFAADTFVRVLRDHDQLTAPSTTHRETGS